MIDHIVIYCVPARVMNQQRATLEDEVARGAGLVAMAELRLDRVRIFSVDDLSQFRQRLLAADRISGVDLLARDLPMIFDVGSAEFRCLPLFRQLGGKTNDLLALAANAFGREPWLPEFRAAWTLDSLARATLDRSRTGTGEEATIHLSRGEWSSAVSYAIDDVSLVRELCFFAEKYGYLVSPSGQRVNLRARMAWNPHRTSDPLMLTTASENGELPSTQKPASLEELMRECEQVIQSAEEVLKQ